MPRRNAPTPTHVRLRSLFGRILGLTGGVTLACGGATSDPASASRSLCGSSRPESFPAGLRASPLQDYVALRSESAFLQSSQDGGTPEGEESWASTTSTSSGTPCVTASRPDDCHRRLAALHLLPRSREECESTFPNTFQPGGRRPGCRVSYLVYTRGDEVGSAVSDDEVAVFLGTIDTVAEADWVLRRSWEPTCGGAKGEDFTVRETDGGYEFAFVNNCERESIIRTVHVAGSGVVTERARRKAEPGTQFTCAVAGRRPDGFEQGPAAKDATLLGAWFSEMAELEAAAVVAFRRLSRELASLGAPPELLARVRDAVRDEVRHARTMRAFAKRHGALPKALAVPPMPRRDALQVALENAREGCVREAYGALVAWHQAIHAADGDVRAAMTAIADDEIAHAALSADIEAWLSGRLGERDRRQVARERADAFRSLERELSRAPVTEAAERVAFERRVGLPPPERARAMLAALADVGVTGARA